MIRFVYLTLSLLVLSSKVWASPPADSTKKKSVIAIPYGNYTEETSWAAGIAANYYLWKQNQLDRVSSFSLNATYTLENQVIVGLYNRYYFANNYYLYGRVLFEKYPDLFWGIGNQNSESNSIDFVPTRYHINLEPQKFITDHILVGLSLQSRHESIKPGLSGKTISKSIPGAEAYYAHALGGIFAIDSRNNIYYPSKGIYLKTALNYFAPVLGSEYNFADLKIDFRVYKEMKDQHIIANQTIVQCVMGTAPFQMTPTFGGLDQMRGYRNGRYRDNIYIMNQTELRFPLYKRILGALFFGVANVWDKPQNMNLQDLKVAFGAGLRFRINDAKINLRGDGAITKDGKPGYYITSIEAF